MNKMREEKQKLRILKVAEEKFHRFGIRKVTMDEIARDLRMSKKSLYKYFDTKEALVQSCAENIAASIIPKVSAIFDAKGTAREKFHAILSALSQLPRLVSAEFAADLVADYPHIWEEIDRQRQEMIRRVEALISEGAASGEIHKDIHPKVMGRILLAVINEVLTPKAFALGEYSTEQAVKTIVALFSSGLSQGKKSAAGKGAPA
jgi:AcrR family transcriptional regulator